MEEININDVRLLGHSVHILNLMILFFSSRPFRRDLTFFRNKLVQMFEMDNIIIDIINKRPKKLPETRSETRFSINSVSLKF